MRHYVYIKQGLKKALLTGLGQQRDIRWGKKITAAEARKNSLLKVGKK